MKLEETVPLLGTPVVAARYGAGESPPSLLPGDFILTASESYVGRAIRLGQRIRFHDHIYDQWNGYNHAAGITTASGDLIEMLAGGATASHLGKYHQDEYWHFPCPDPYGAPVAVAYWEWVLENHTGYNWTAALSDGITCLTGSKLTIGSRGRLICSGMVAAGYCHAGMPSAMKWVADPSHVFPCELGVNYASRR